MKTAMIQLLGCVAVAYDCETENEIFSMRIPQRGKQGVMPRRFHAKLAALGYDADRNVYPDICGQMKIWVGQPKKTQ